MKGFVALSDLHAHPWSAFAKGDGINNSRLQHSLQILAASLQRAQDDEIPWIFAGDLVHTAGYALNVVMAGITNVMASFPDVPKIMVWGNHDARGVGGKITLEQTCLTPLLHAVPNLEILDPSLPNHGITEVDGTVFAGAGYQPDVKLFDDGKNCYFVGAPELGIDVGIYHQTVRNSQMATGFVLEEGIDPKKLTDYYDITIVGHIHHPQTFPDTNILVPGSPEQHNFGDKGDHGWWVIKATPETGAPELEFIDGGSPKFITVDTVAEVENDGHFYRVRTVPEGYQAPDGIAVVAPTPTVVKPRGALEGVAHADEVVETWLDTAPPPKGKRTEYYDVGTALLEAEEPRQLRDFRLQEIGLHNFCCFADQGMVVKDGTWLVTGTGKDYPSNGAGKTTLVGEALYWLLFGRTTKGFSADEVIRKGTSECIVNATLQSSCGTLLQVERQRLHPSGSFLTVVENQEAWEAASVTEMTAKLGERLGITPDIFKTLAYFSQEDLMLFSSATDGERKNVLADLIGLTAYQAASTEAASRAQQAQVEAGQAAVRENTLLEQIDAQKDVLRESNGRVKDWEDNQAAFIKDAEARVQHLQWTAEHQEQSAEARRERIQQRAEENIAAYRKRRNAERARMVDEARADLEAEAVERVETVEAQLRTRVGVAIIGFEEYENPEEAAAEAVAQLPEQEKALDVLTETFNRLAKQRSETESEMHTLTVKREAYASALAEATAEWQQAQKYFSGGKCPTCKQMITPEHATECLAPIKDRMVQREADLEEAKHAFELKQTVLTEHTQAAKDCQQETHNLNISVMALRETSKQLDRVAVLRSELQAAKAEAGAQALEDHVDAQIEHNIAMYTAKQHARVRLILQTLTRRQNDGAREQQRVAAQLADLKAQTNPHVAAKDKALQRLSEMSLQREAATEAVARAKVAEEMWLYWYKGFSKQGVQSLLVEEIAVLFNNNRSNIFPLLTQGVYDVQFSTLSQTRKGELREKTDFYIFEHGKQVSYASLSGGQRRRIDIGVMLVLAQAVAGWMGAPGVLGLMILDEVFGFLDASGAEGLVAALEQINAHVPTIYVVTHDAALQALIPNVLHVVQGDDGVSKVME